MRIINKREWLKLGGVLTAVLMVFFSLFLQGCSQQITSTSFVQKAKSLVDVMSDGTNLEQSSPFSKISTSGINQYLPLVKKYSQQYGVDWVLVLALMKQESRFNHEAVSYKGAYGLMQIMPLTQIELAERIGIEETTTPRNNIKAGIYHLKTLYDEFRNIPRDDRICLTLASYNAGLGRVIDAQKVATYMGNDPHHWSSVRAALPFLSKKNYTLHSRIWNDGYPPSGYFRSSKQTIEYVDNIMKNYDRYGLALQ